MGSPFSELGKESYETQHQVTLTKSFYMQTTEVTQGQWKAVMGSNPSYFSSCGDNCPVEQVSWDDIQGFITSINKRGEGTYRLPTEAEWEYAARSGSTSAFANGRITYTSCQLDTNLNAMGWYCGNSSYKTHPVGQKQANALGLYDMHGNVEEWCSDWYNGYPASGVTDPAGPSEGSQRVIRGGHWSDYSRDCRSASRSAFRPDFRYYWIGFRLLRVAPDNR
jgi:formylglycine-generating enzyme required for sulfatase activity